MVLRTSTAAVALTSLLLFSSRTLAASPVYIGCYSSSDGLTEFGTYQYQSSGYCQGKCVDEAGNQAVLGLTNGDDCYCGGQIPPASDKVDDSRCSTPCTGYGQVSCGGDSFWSVYTTGTDADISSTDGSAVPAGGQSNGGRSSSGSPTRSSQPSVVTSISPGRTIVVTQSPTAIASENKGPANGEGDNGGGSSKTGVIVGVIIGVVALIAIGVGLWFFLVKKRKQQDAESNTGPMSAGSMAETPKEWKIPSAARHTQYGRPGGGDSRLNDNVAGNRASSYSLDDSNDYTRKILTVANPDR